MSREPKRVVSVFYEDIENGEMPGKWLLSYREDNSTNEQVLLGLSIAVAVFDAKEAALEMAAKLDDLMGTERLWEVDTIFIGENHDADELASMIWGDSDDEDDDGDEDA